MTAVEAKRRLHFKHLSSDIPQTVLTIVQYIEWLYDIELLLIFNCIAVWFVSGLPKKNIPDYSYIASVGKDQPGWLESMTVNGNFIMPRPTTKVSRIMRCALLLTAQVL